MRLKKKEKEVMKIEKEQLEYIEMETTERS